MSHNPFIVDFSLHPNIVHYFSSVTKQSIVDFVSTYVDLETKIRSTKSKDELENLSSKLDAVQLQLNHQFDTLPTVFEQSASLLNINKSITDLVSTHTENLANIDKSIAELASVNLEKSLMETIKSLLPQELNSLKLDLLSTITSSLGNLHSSNMSVNDKIHAMNEAVNSTLSTYNEKLLETRLNTSQITSSIKECLANFWKDNMF